MLVNLSNIIIPALIFYVVAYGIASKTPVYEEFIKGAQDGMKTVVQIMPTLIGLMMAVGILRASGFMEFTGELLGGILDYVNFPAQLVPVTLVKMFSSSAATGLVIDIFKEFGPDSYIGYATSLMMSSTETIFYTMSVYFLVAKVHKTKFTLVGALLSTIVGAIVSIILAGYMMPK